MHYPRFLPISGFLIVVGTIILTLVGFTKVTPSSTSQLQKMPIIVPPLLKQHDTVAIVAPAWWDTNEETIIKETKKILQDWGLEVVIGNSIGARYGQFAGDDKLRLVDLQSMLDNPKIRAIFALRGGHGSARMIDSLEFSNFFKHPKWLIGFSDITTIHLKLHQLGIVSIHGEMPKHFPDAAYATSIHSLKVALFEGTAQLTCKAQVYNRSGQTLAPVVGGNLATICSNIGTPTDLDTRGKILVLEDVGEQVYAVDRMMLQLKRAGKLQDVAALIIGGMVAMKDSVDIPFGKTIEELIIEHVGAYNYPVAFGMPISHTAPNLAFLHGAIGELIVTEKSVRLSFGN
jgi:muramoyltetrapeptide carboxypeptidase